MRRSFYTLVAAQEQIRCIFPWASRDKHEIISKERPDSSRSPFMAEGRYPLVGHRSRLTCIFADVAPLCYI